MCTDCDGLTLPIGPQGTQGPPGNNGTNGAPGMAWYSLYFNASASGSDPQVWTSIGEIIYPGTLSVANITKILVNLYAVKGGVEGPMTGEVKIIDITNSDNVIAYGLASTTDSLNIINISSTISNLPTYPALFSIQIKVDSTLNIDFVYLNSISIGSY